MRRFARAALFVADDYHVRAAQFRLVVVEVHEPPEIGEMHVAK